MDHMGAKVCYGVDLGEGFAAVVRASGSGRTPGLRTLMASSEGAGAGSWPAAAAEMVAAGTRRRALIVAAIPARDTVVRRLAAPMASLRRARSILPSLLDVQLPFPLEECECEYLDLRAAGDGRTGALAVAARRDAIARRAAECSAAGFDPMILDAEGLAIWTQAAAEIRPEGDALRAVAYAGADRAVLAVGRGRDLESVHAVRWNVGEGREAGVAGFVQRARQALQAGGVTDASPADWIWCGPGARPDGVAGDIEKTLSGAAVRFRRADEPATFLARALAIRALRGGTMACNLRSGALAQPDLVRWLARRADRAAATCLAAGLMLAASGVGWTVWLDGRVAAANAAVAAAAREVGHLSRVQPGLEVRMAGESVQKRLDEEAALARAFQPAAAGRLAGVMRVASQNDLWIETATLGTASTELGGTAPNWEACARLEAFLKTVGYKTDLRKQDAGDEGRVRFVLKGLRS